MDATAVVILVAVILVVIVVAVLYQRRSAPPKGPILMAPPPEASDSLEPSPGMVQPSTPPPAESSGKRRTRSADHLFDEPKPSAGVEKPAPSTGEPSQPQMQPPPPQTRSASEETKSGPGGAATATTEAVIPTEAVRFTAFHPKEAAVATWYTLLVYAHVESALSKVQQDAAKFKEEMGGVPREVRSTAPAQLARGTEITIVPTCEGVTFNPERVAFKWVEDVHRADFRFQAGKELADSAANILVTIFVGPLIVATIKGGILFSAQEPVRLPLGVNAQTTASLYKSEEIFPSYSHDDEEIVVACRDAYKALGFDFLRDRDTLRPGEDWNTALKQMIDRADIFQLFWSEHSARSTYCQQEWQYALQQNRAKGSAFVRPVYWEQPLVPPPPELADLHFAYVPLAKPRTP